MIGYNDATPQPICRPTSLDFINAPNPIEPVTTQQQHPTTSASWLEQATTSPNGRHISRDASAASINVVGPNHERHRSGDTSSSSLLNLPKLPVANNQEQGRVRIPPTLSGLHQPPPNAGLLPSISTEQPKDIAVVAPVSRSSAISSSAHNDPKDTPELPPEWPRRQTIELRKRGEPKLIRTKWSDDETADLLKGVARYGIGHWTKILRHPDYHFNDRTGLDLKDRFRVCCPEHHKGTRVREKKARSTDRFLIGERPSNCERKSASDLRALGIMEPFAPSTRRKRDAYSAAEDEAIVRGVEKHGNAWASIRSDPEFSMFLNRTATDLRDRHRARFPEKHKQLSLRARSKASNEHSKTSRGSTKNKSAHQPSSNHEELEGPSLNSSALEFMDTPSLSNPTDPPQASTTSHDVFWGLSFDEFVSEGDRDRITLDRAILDWALDGMNKTVEGHADTTGPIGGIEPTLASFSSPLPGAGGWSQMSSARPAGGGGGGGGAAGAALQSSGSASTLPSLAIVTAGMIDGHDAGDQLELPSLGSGLGGLEADGRSSSQLMSLYDILS